MNHLHDRDGGVIDLVSSDEENEEEQRERIVRRPLRDASSSLSTGVSSKGSCAILRNPYHKKQQAEQKEKDAKRDKMSKSAKKATPSTVNANGKKGKHKASPSSVSLSKTTRSATESFFVVEEDLETHHTWQDDEEMQEKLHQFRQQQRQSTAALLLFQDEDFPCHPGSIRGRKVAEETMVSQKPPSCRCRGNIPAKLSFAKKNPQRPVYTCDRPQAQRCNYFAPAFTAERMHWYRLGGHTGHVLVRQRGNGATPSFSAQDLKQGKVGDCWFLSALAVVAERPDLIQRLFPATNSASGNSNMVADDGIVQVRLFLDGFWKIVTIDNFLPCMILHDDDERALQAALQASVTGVTGAMESPPLSLENPSLFSSSSSSKHNPHALTDTNRTILQETQDFVSRHYQRLTGQHATLSSPIPDLTRVVTSSDLAYSKAAHNQLWVPFLEKAYAKSHGCYQSISGGHIAEAFLDLTGAPTVVHNLLQSDHHERFDPRAFWYQLMQYRRQRLPMGCGTNSSAAGIVGMHAYSILDVQEIKNVDFRFFQETGVAHGNVSGFTEYDGTVRLLRIRNPHGQGEWNGDFSDKSGVWERLLEHSGNRNILERTMRNDGTFWIDYDNFLMAFSNVDVVMAFQGNHGKSFACNFPSKKSNHRCTRAFEVSLVEDQPGMESNDTVEIYVMGIQKTRRGARSGRVDRKVSYKLCDFGVLVGEGYKVQEIGENQFTRVTGQMFGFNRNGHKRLVLDRKSLSSLVVMPISFGHPAATDKELPFVLRFVSDAPLVIRELDNTPRMDTVMGQYCFTPMSPITKQRIHKILFENSCCRIVQIDCRASSGGTVFLYLCINEMELHRQGCKDGISFSVQANCRGMSCRTAEGLMTHETVAKGKKFEAAWRRYSADYVNEKQSRLLMVLYQSGQDTEFGAITCQTMDTGRKLGSIATEATLDTFVGITAKDEYDRLGVFNPPKNGNAYGQAATLEEQDAHNFQPDPQNEHLVRTLVESSQSVSATEDILLQQALAESRANSAQGARYDSTTNSVEGVSCYDADIMRAIALSRNDVHSTEHITWPDNDVNLSTTTIHPQGSFDEDLSKAMKLSLECPQPPMSNPSSKEIRPKVEVLDLTHEVESPKRQKIHHADEEEEYHNPTKPMSLDEKRRLAAEAAFKRFSKHAHKPEGNGV